MTHTSLPTRILGGRYQLVRPIGSGGMGSVYAAVDLRLGGEVAVKVLHPRAEPSILERFRLEARVTASLGNPHIVRVTDFQENPGEQPFIVMEKIEGVSLKTLIETSGRLPERRAAAIAAQILSALWDAHAAGILHRDVKPANILVSSSPAGDLVKVVDFGLARLEPPPFAQPTAPTCMQLTAAGELVGTAGFVAPEHLRGEPLDGRADLYAVGATLFQMLTGCKPFDGMSLPYWMATAQRKSPRIDAAACGIDPGLAAVVHRAMSVRKLDRYTTAYEMMLALAPWSDRRGVPQPRARTSSATLLTPYEERPIVDASLVPIESRSRTIRRARAAQSSLVARLVWVGLALTVAAVVLVVAQARKAEARARATSSARTITASAVPTK